MFARNAISPGPAASSVATPLISISASPATSQPKICASCPRVYVAIYKLRFRNDRVSQFSNWRDAHHDFFSRVQIARGLSREAHAAGRSSGDHVTRFQRENAREERKQVRDFENQLARVR